MSDGEGNDEDFDSLRRNNRILRVDQVWSRKDRQTHFIKTARAKVKKDRFAKYSLVIRRIIDQKGTLSSVEVDIKSPKLASVLIKIFKDIDGLRLTGDTPTLDIKLFYYAREGMKECLEEESGKALPDRDLMADLTTALDFIDEECASTTADLNSLLPHGDIHYVHLWAIFLPNTILFSSGNSLKQPQIFKFSSAHYIHSKGPGGVDPGFYVNAKILHHNGESFGWGVESFCIVPFEGNQKIRKLPIYPLKFHPESDDVQREMIGRGRHYLSLIEKPTCREYEGLAVGYIRDDHTRPPPPVGVPIPPMGVPPPPGMAAPRPMRRNFTDRESRFESTGRIILDPVAFSKHETNSPLLQPDITEKLDREQLTDDEIMLCNHRVLGFSFRAKEWGAFSVSQTMELVWNENAFDRLILDDRKRRMIKTLVESHRTDDDVFDDIVRGKGKGLVGLLSGTPGVGKTLTAEAVAEMTRRPLYVVSAGELGTNITLTDSRLSRALEITRRWGCVLLIDEADVFLRKRDISDLARNALVSLFLRRLEYFQGIMILTTNRDEDIDEAFKSRIHFKFNYPSLGEQDRAKLWEDFLSHLPSDITVSAMNHEDFRVLAKHPLNGREIKNAVACAALIVRSRQELLTVAFMLEIIETLFDDRVSNPKDSGDV